MEDCALVFPTIVSKWLLVLPGFGPAAEVLLFRQKDPKPWWPWRGPSGSLRRVADFGGAQTRFAQTMRAFLRNRLHDLASPQGHGSLVKEGANESLELLKDGIDFMFCAAGRTAAQKDIKKAPVPFLDTNQSCPGKQTLERPRPDQIRWSRLERCMIARPNLAPQMARRVCDG